MSPPRRGASLLLMVIALFVAHTVQAQNAAQPQNPAQDGVSRNALERQQRENEFHVKLYDNAPPKSTARTPSLPLPLETSPRSTLDLGEPLPPNPRTTQAIAPRVSDTAQQLQWDLSQQQRLQQLQQQNKDLPEPVRQQQMQIQQLQFDRENNAQGLHDRIMRDSQGSMQQVR
jgi:hypothetical protein